MDTASVQTQLDPGGLPLAPAKQLRGKRGLWRLEVAADMASVQKQLDTDGLPPAPTRPRDWQSCH